MTEPPEPPLIAYMNAENRATRSVAWLHLYAHKVRNGTAASFDIPNTIADTIGDIARHFAHIADTLAKIETMIDLSGTEETDPGHIYLTCIEALLRLRARLVQEAAPHLAGPRHEAWIAKIDTFIDELNRDVDAPSPPSDTQV